MPEDWPWPIDTSISRREVHDRLGGQEQGGISTPRGITDVLVFTDPDSGRRYGYDKFEGLRADGGYSYTGEGQHGPQTFIRGNRSILRTAETGGLVRLFRTRRTNATYVGAFTLGDPPFEMRQIPDVDGLPREGIIFNLVPVDADTALLPTYGSEVLPASIASSEWSEPDASTFAFNIVEAEATRTVSRFEFELQRDFGNWLKAQGYSPQNLRIPVEGAAIQPDLYEPQTGLVVEAKKSSARSYVRQALGQVLDYDFCIRGTGRLSVPAILLPSAPSDDLVALCDECEVAVITRDGDEFATRGTTPLDCVPPAT